MKRCTALALFLLLDASCKKREEPVLPPGLLNGQGQPLNQEIAVPVPTPPPAPSEPSTYDFERTPDPGPGSLAASPSQAQAAAANTATPSAEAAPPSRDLDAEFSSQLSRLSSCVDPAKAAAQPDGRLTISVEAQVLSSGRVSRATIDAPGQPESARTCAERAVLAMQLGGDVPGAPVRVKGTTEVQVKASARPDAGTTTTNGAPRPAPSNPDIARPDPGELARPDPPDLAGPP